MSSELITHLNDFVVSPIDSASNNNNSDVVEFLVRYYDNLDKIYQ
jgi:hypothetical protein